MHQWSFRNAIDCDGKEFNEGVGDIGDVRPGSISLEGTAAARFLFSDTLTQLRLNPLMLTKTSPVPTGFLMRKALLSRFRQAVQAAWQAGSMLHELNKRGGTSADFNNLIQT